MTHAEAFNLDRAIADMTLPYAAHPSLFAGEPEDPQVTIRRLEDEIKRMQQEIDARDRKLHAIYEHAIDAENVVAKILGECRA